MHNSQLFSYLFTFEKSEWTPFGKYLKGSIGESSETFKLYRFILTHKDNLRSSKLTIATLQKKEFKNIVRKTILNLMSKLKKEIEEYWIIEELKQEELNYELYRIKALQRRELYKEANKVAEVIKNETTRKDKLSLSDVLTQLSVDHELYFSLNPIKKGNVGKALLGDCFNHIQRIEHVYNLYYRAAALNRENLFHEDWTSYTQPIELQKSDGNLLVSVLSHANEVVAYKKQEATQLLVNYLLQEDITISEDIAISLYTYTWHAVNHLYQIKAIEVEELIEFISKATRLGRTLYKNKIPTYEFLNNFNALLSLSTVEVARQYVQDSEKYLPKDMREILLRISENKILYKQEDYNQLIFNIQNKTGTSFFERRHDHKILLQAYMDSYGDEPNFVLNQIRNFRDFLNRNKEKAGKYSYHGHVNFLDICKDVITNKPQEFILNKMEVNPNVFFRKWLTDKIRATE